jgi:hypothetical protein
LADLVLAKNMAVFKNSSVKNVAAWGGVNLLENVHLTLGSEFEKSHLCWEGVFIVPWATLGQNFVELREEPVLLKFFVDWKRVFDFLGKIAHGGRLANANVPANHDFEG